MRLLVSVRDADEAAAALAGGADIVDAKEPAAGALGAVSVDTFAQIARAVGGVRPITAALGDAADGQDVEDLARTFVRAGAHLVKLGLAGCDAPRARTALRAAARGAGRGHIVAVAYADHQYAQAPSPAEVLRLAAEMGVAGILVDTADKAGAGLCGLVAASAMSAWVADARRADLLVALAGQLTAEDVAGLAGSGADILGVRGAACEHGRAGRVSPARVRALLHALSTAVVAP